MANVKDSKKYKKPTNDGIVVLLDLLIMLHWLRLQLQWIKHLSLLACTLPSSINHRLCSTLPISPCFWRSFSDRCLIELSHFVLSSTSWIMCQKYFNLNCSHLHTVTYSLALTCLDQNCSLHVESEWSCEFLSVLHVFCRALAKLDHHLCMTRLARKSS